MGSEKKNKFKSGATYGSEFEAKIDSWAEQAGIPWEIDKTLGTDRKRKKGQGCDRRYIVGDRKVNVELKTLGKDASLPVSLYPNHQKTGLKFHQVCAMDYLIVECRPYLPVAVRKEDLLIFMCAVKKNSVNRKDVLKIGFEIEGMEWLKDV